MLKINLAPHWKAHGIRQPYSWLIKQGFPVVAARNFKAGAYRNIPLAHLERLCLLLRCTPNDILAWVPDAGADTTTQPLRALLPKGNEGLEWLDDMQRMNLDELRELGKKIAAIKQEEEGGKV